MREDKKTVAVAGQAEPDTPFRRKCRIAPALSRVYAWAAPIKAVYEVDPLKCPHRTRIIIESVPLAPELFMQQNGVTTAAEK